MEECVCLQLSDVRKVLAPYVNKTTTTRDDTTRVDTVLLHVRRKKKNCILEDKLTR